jgi:hypothetical protein
MERFAIAALAVLLALPATAEDKFRIPSLAQAAFGDQAEVDPVDIDILVAGQAGTGVISGCAVTAQGSPDMTLAVASGSVRVGTTIAAVSSGNVTITTAHATLPRFDLVVVNSSGTKSVTAGTASTNPVFPAIPATSVVLASVYVPAADTTIQDNQIIGKQVLLSSFSGFSLTAPRVPFAGSGGVLTDDADMTFVTDTLTIAKVATPLGSAGAPSYSFTGDPNTGIFSSGADIFDISAGGTSRVSVSSTAFTSSVQNLAALGSAGAPTYSFTGDTNAGIYSAAADSINIATGGVSRFAVQLVSIPFSLQLQGPAGSASGPTYSFSTDGNSGVWSSQDDSLDLASAGVTRLAVQSFRLLATVPHTGAAGTATDPTYSFSADSNTGMFSSAADEVAISTGGTTRATITSAGSIFGTAAGAADAVAINETAGQVTFGGSTADTIESRVSVADPTVGDQLFQFPNLAAAGTYKIVLSGFSKTLTESTNTSAFQVSVPDNAGTGGTVIYSVFASDATAHQVRSGAIYFSAVAEGTTETCATPTDVGTSQITATTGTLTCSFDCDETPANAVNIQFNCTSSLAQTTLTLYYRPDVVGPGQVTPQ